MDWQPGKYGGTLSMLHFRPDWNSDIFVGMNERLLSVLGRGAQGIRGHILKGYEAPNNQPFVFQKRTWKAGNCPTLTSCSPNWRKTWK